MGWPDNSVQLFDGKSERLSAGTAKMSLSGTAAAAEESLRIRRSRLIRVFEVIRTRYLERLNPHRSA